MLELVWKTGLEGVDGFIWPKIRRSGRLLRTRQWIFRCHEVRRISQLAKQLSVSLEIFCCMELLAEQQLVQFQQALEFI